MECYVDFQKLNLILPISISKRQAVSPVLSCLKAFCYFKTENTHGNLTLKLQTDLNHILYLCEIMKNS